jgi:fructose-bisphosphate aldolase class I
MSISLTPLEKTIEAMMAPGKGLLAADESFKTIGIRFEELGIESTEESRLAYRRMLFTTPKLSEFISGVILYDETIRQKIDGILIPKFLAAKGLIPGIKVDLGTTSLPEFPTETITEGLDGLRERLAEYQFLGARFSKWRAVIRISETAPSRACLETNAHRLAVFASLSQEAGIVPIIEPETLMTGPHSMARCEEVTRETLETVFTILAQHHVSLEHLLLKTNMVSSGDTSIERPTPAEVAVATIRCFQRAVPAAVPGILFLSGGQSETLATERLQLICKIEEKPWRITFSFGRALQEPAMPIWLGHEANIPAAQRALHDRALANSLAVQGSKT